MASALSRRKRPRRTVGDGAARGTEAAKACHVPRLADDPLAAHGLPRTITLRPPPPVEEAARTGDAATLGAPGGVAARPAVVEARLRADTGQSLGPVERDWALRAVERALRPMYDRAPAMRWSAAEKRREFGAAEQRFILVLPCEKDSAADTLNAAGRGLADGVAVTPETPNMPLGFVSYRVDLYDEEMPPSATAVETDGTLLSSGDISSPSHAVYVYELYVSEGARGRGIGLALMELLEQICSHAHIGRIVLTVFDENITAMRLYKQRLGYVVDRSSPCLWGVCDAGYQILSKPLAF